MSDDWTFTVTWDPEAGPLPMPILRLFLGNSSRITIGEAVRETDRGHAAHYAKAVDGYLAEHKPGRMDIVAEAEEAGA